MNITYGKGFEPALTMRERVERLQQQIAAAVRTSGVPAYQPVTKHYFHGGMYCREVHREAGALVIGRVHKKEHFYVVASGIVEVTTDEGVQRVMGPTVIKSSVGTKRAVLALTPVISMTFHVCSARTVEQAERELVEDDPDSMFAPGNLLNDHAQEVLP